MACPRAAGVVAAVWLSGALAQQVAFHPDALAAGAPGVQSDAPPGHLELRDPGFGNRKAGKKSWVCGRGGGQFGGFGEAYAAA